MTNMIEIVFAILLSLIMATVLFIGALFIIDVFIVDDTPTTSDIQSHTDVVTVIDKHNRNVCYIYKYKGISCVPLLEMGA